MVRKNGSCNGIPRDMIKWHPTIDYDKCVSCMACVSRCTHGVYAKRGGRPEVVNPGNCVVGCTGCHSVCPAGAINHPPASYLGGLAGKRAPKMTCGCGGKCK